MPEDDPLLRDEDGEPLLPCQPSSALPDTIRFATMAGEASCGDASKATVEADDVRGVCSLYPLGEDPGTCQAPAPLEAETGCGCRATGISSPATAWGWLAGAGLLAVRSRKRSRRCRTGRTA